MLDKKIQKEFENTVTSLEDNKKTKRKNKVKIYNPSKWDYYSNRDRYWMKWIFFVIITLTYLIAFSIAIYFFFVALNLDNNVAKIATILGSLATFITTIITLPTIIAKHLFPINETEKKLKLDATTDKVINNRQNYDDSKLDDEKKSNKKRE